MRSWPIALLLIALAAVASAQNPSGRPRTSALAHFDFVELQVHTTKVGLEVHAEVEWLADDHWFRVESRATVRGKDDRAELAARQDAVDSCIKQLLGKLGIADPRSRTADGYYAWPTRSTVLFSLFGAHGWFPHEEPDLKLVGETRTRTYRFYRET